MARPRRHGESSRGRGVFFEASDTLWLLKRSYVRRLETLSTSFRFVKGHHVIN